MEIFKAENKVVGADTLIQLSLYVLGDRWQSGTVHVISLP